MASPFTPPDIEGSFLRSDHSRKRSFHLGLRRTVAAARLSRDARRPRHDGRGAHVPWAIARVSDAHGRLQVGNGNSVIRQVKQKQQTESGKRAAAATSLNE